MVENNVMFLEYCVPIYERAEIDGEFCINGIAINETTTSNGHKFISDELLKSASTLIGVPLLKDHNNSVDAIIGRVKAAHYSEEARNIPFKAVVKEKKYQEMIKDGRINSVSVGAYVKPEDIEEGENGDIIPHNIIFKELSLVAVPADSGATFSMALQQSWNKFKDIDTSKEKNDTLITERGFNTQREMAEQTQALTETKTEAEVEVKEETKIEVKEEVKEDVNKKLLELIDSIDKRLSKLEQSKIEVKETKVETKESAVEEIDEDEEVAIKDKFEIVSGHKSFSVVRNKY